MGTWVASQNGQCQSTSSLVHQVASYQLDGPNDPADPDTNPTLFIMTWSLRVDAQVPEQSPMDRMTTT